jgi:hypothetical protein
MSTFRLRALKLSDLDNHTADSPGKQTRPAPSNCSDCPLTETVKKGKLFKIVEGVPINFMECSNLLKTKCFRNWNDESMAFVERFCNFSALLLLGVLLECLAAFRFTLLNWLRASVFFRSGETSFAF